MRLYIKASVSYDFTFPFLFFYFTKTGNYVRFLARYKEGKNMALEGLPGFIYAMVSQDQTLSVRLNLRGSGTQGIGLY